MQIRQPWPREFWRTVAVFAALWGVVIYRIGPPFWSSYPDYSFGYSVPFLCLYLVWERWKSRPPAGEDGRSKLEVRGRIEDGRLTMEDRENPISHLPSSTLSRLALAAVVVLALSLLPSFLVQEANLIWLSMSWVVTLQALGITFCLLFLAGGWSCLNHFWFPFFFFLTAIHWGPMEAPIIGVMSQLNAATALEALGLWGIPAVQHGNVLEISTGMVGIDEACSGIRSFHAVLMISLFFGELYRFTVMRRVSLLLAGVALAFVCNVLRTFTLTVVCARQGMEAMAKWHDPTGVSILVACFMGLWFISLRLSGKGEAQSAERQAPSVKREGESAERSAISVEGEAQSAQSSARLALPALPFALSLCLLAWLGVVELAVEGWYRMHEVQRPSVAAWTAHFPTDQRGAREVEISSEVQENLKFDEGKSVAWEAPDGTTWHGFYFRWNPPATRNRRAWVQRAMGHHPERCLSGTGMKLTSDAGTRLIKVQGFTLPFRAFEFLKDDRPMHVFHCLWHDGTPATIDENSNATATTVPRLTSVFTGNRNRDRGVRSLEIAIWGYADVQHAEAALKRQLERMVVVEEPIRR